MISKHRTDAVSTVESQQQAIPGPSRVANNILYTRLLQGSQDITCHDVPVNTKCVVHSIHVGHSLRAGPLAQEKLLLRSSRRY